MKKKNIILAIVVVLLVALVVWKLAGNKKEINAKSQATDTAAIAIPVKADTARMQMVELSIIKTGTVVPFKESKVVSTGSGNITRIHFELGSRVAKGQVLAALDNRSNALQVQNAQANAAKLKNDLQTYQELLEGKATTAQKVKDLQQQYSEAVNQLAQLQKQSSDASIKAPISGIISSKDVEAGLFASPGTQIATIVDIAQTKVQVNISETEVYQVKQGQKVTITADVFPGHKFTGTVTFISPQADETHNYLVELNVANDSESLLRSGTFVNVDFSVKTTQQVLVIPTQAISGSGEDALVYIIKNNRVYQRKIRTGRALQDKSEILDGLQQSDIIVVSGQINLKDGTLIRISQ